MSLELPELKTIRCEIAPHLNGQTISNMTLRCAKLRLPLAPDLPDALAEECITTVERRAKYLLIWCPAAPSRHDRPPAADPDRHSGRQARLSGLHLDKGTTLHDYLNGEGKSGYFRLDLKVYQRGGEPCSTCNTTLDESRLWGRPSCW